MSADYWNEEKEKLSRDEISDIQKRKLRKQVQYAYDNTEYFKHRLDEFNVNPSDIRTIDDYQRKIPFVIKEDLRNRDSPQDFIAVDQEDLDWIHASTGTTGKPTHQVVSKNDKSHMTEYLSRYHYGAGVRENDTVLDLWMYYHLFSHWADLAYEAMDVTLFRRGGFPFEVENDLETISVWTDMDPDVIHIPFNGLFEIKKYLKEKSLAVDDIFPSLKSIQTGGAIWTESLRDNEESFWGVPIYDVGGPTDTLSCGVTMCEGHENNWYHWWEDLMFAEVIDFETREVIGPGERGELVYTNLNASATPYLRWRSEDAVLHGGYNCVCGREHFIGKILGRTGDQIKIDGKNIFLRDLEETLHEFEDISNDDYQIVRSPDGPQDRIVLRLPIENIDDRKIDEIHATIESDLQVEVDIESHTREENEGEWKPDTIVEEEL